MKLAVGCDHAGLILKGVLIAHLVGLGHEVEDVGTYTPASTDYPDYAALVGQKVASGAADRGLLICGSGLGMCIAANKISGIRAVVMSETYSAHVSREHNDANVLCMGERVVGQGLAKDILEIWLSSTFLGGRHQARVDKIRALDG